jgi:hypothetical protein
MSKSRPKPKKQGKAKKKVELTPQNVMAALHELGFHKRGQLVTAEMVANRMEVKLPELARVLRILKKRKAIYRRRREGKVVWFPIRGQRA